MSITQSTTAKLRIISFESRLSSTMTELIHKAGHAPIAAPALQEIPLEKNPEAFQLGERLLNHEIDFMIFLTGVGTKALFETLRTRYNMKQIIAALNQTIIVARGPKPVQVLQDYGIMVSVLVPEPNTWRDILEVLDSDEHSISLMKRTVAVQEYGEENPQLIAGLVERGARVIRVPVYRWALPDDTKPLKNAIRTIIEHNADAVLFTNSVQVNHLFRLASEIGLERHLKQAFAKMVIASVGPHCSQAIVEHGLSVDIQPETPNMESLVLEVSKRAKAIWDEKQLHESKLMDSGIRMESERVQKKELVESVFLKACRLEKTSHTPVWLMRQAGRYMKEYRQLREKMPFLELCKNPSLCAEVTIHAQETIGADAAIIFSDILLLVQPFGLGLEYSREDGPVIDNVIHRGSRIDELPEIEPADSLGFVYEAIRKTRENLQSNIPLIGFAGAPFTLASYMIEGGSSKDFRRTKLFMYSDEGQWRALMEKLARAVSKHLKAQIEAGAQAVQLFDSWVGCLGPGDYKKYVQPYSKQVFDSLEGLAPTIHFGTNTGNLLELMKEAGGDVIGVDFRITLDQAWRRVGYSKAVQGNLDPLVLQSSIPYINQRAQEIIKQASGRPGHIFNLGHGVLPDTPVENVIALVDMVHELSGK